MRRLAATPLEASIESISFNNKKQKKIPRAIPLGGRTLSQNRFLKKLSTRTYMKLHCNEKPSRFSG